MKLFSVLFGLLFSALAAAHIALYEPACYGCRRFLQEAAKPLSNKRFEDWWFHGGLHLPPPPDTKPITLPAGGSFEVDLSCHYMYSQFNESREANPDNHACRHDMQAMHTAPNEKSLKEFNPAWMTGCGMAIAYKSEATQVKPTDFTVFSVNHNCVRNLTTTFEVPTGMPECPNGKCICSWFWQGRSSEDEMYMTGFDCTVTGGSKTASLAQPQIPKFCASNPSSCVKGAKQPMYWANERPNVDFKPGINENRPSYNMRWGFKDGAQTDIFATKGSIPNPDPTTPKPTPSPSNPPKFETSNVPIGAPPKETTTPPTNPYKDPAFIAKYVNCGWRGHCLDDPCPNDNTQCDHDMACVNGKCKVLGTGTGKKAKRAPARYTVRF